MGDNKKYSGKWKRGLLLKMEDFLQGGNCSNEGKKNLSRLDQDKSIKKSSPKE